MTLTVCTFLSLSGSMFQLNCDQRNILKFVLAGHNALITGQAGVGKSVVVTQSIKNLNQMRKNVAVVCLCYYEISKCKQSLAP